MKPMSLPQLIYLYRMKGFNDPQIRKSENGFKMVVSCPARDWTTIEGADKKTCMRKVLAWVRANYRMVNRARAKLVNSYLKVRKENGTLDVGIKYH